MTLHIVGVKLFLHRGVDKRYKIGYNILITSTLDVIHKNKKEIRR